MFSPVNHFQMFKPGSVNGRCGTLQIQPGNQSKASEQHQTCYTALTDYDNRKHCAHQKHAKQQNEYYSTYSLSFLQRIIRFDLLCNHQHFHG